MWNLAGMGNRVQNERYATQRCKAKDPEHELSEVCGPTPTWGPPPFEQAFVWREHAIHRLADIRNSRSRTKLCGVIGCPVEECMCGYPYDLCDRERNVRRLANGGSPGGEEHIHGG